MTIYRELHQALSAVYSCAKWLCLVWLFCFLYTTLKPNEINI